MMLLAILLLGIHLQLNLCKATKGNHGNTLIVRFSQTPNLLYRTFPLEAICSLCSKDDRKDDSAPSWGFLSDGKVEIIDPEDAKITEVKKNVSKGCHVTYNIHKTVDDKLNGKRLVCFLGKVSSQSCENPRDFRCLQSDVIAVTDAPSKPSVVGVLHHEALHEVTPFSLIEIRCVACEPGKGHIFWALLKGYDVFPLEARSSIVHHINEGSETTDECPYTVISVIVLRALPKVDGGKIACYTFNVSDPVYTFQDKQMWGKLTTPIFVKEKKSGFEQRGYISILWYLMGIMLLGVITFLLAHTPEDEFATGSDSTTSSLDDNDVPMSSMTSDANANPNKRDLTPSMYVSVPSSLELDDD